MQGIELLRLRVRVPTAASSARPVRKDLQTALSIFNTLRANRTVVLRHAVFFIVGSSLRSREFARRKTRVARLHAFCLFSHFH